jgi:hypothetical protein
MIAAIKAIAEALKEPLAAFGRWSNPDRRREARKDRAIQSARELFLIYERQGRYKIFTERMLEEHKVHYRKQFDAWSNG